MSFSSDVKDEVVEVCESGRPCQTAELAALISMSAKVIRDDGGYIMDITSDNEPVVKKIQRYLKETLDMQIQIMENDVFGAKKGQAYEMVLTDKEVSKVLEITGIMVSEDNMRLVPNVEFKKDTKECCRAFLKGVFIAAGSISNPERSYHFEIVCNEEYMAHIIQKVLGKFDLDARIVLRKKYYVVYIKEGEQIADLLNIIKAHKALLEFENILILKGLRNSVNRQVNCEAANINRTVSAALKQIEDIEFIRDMAGLDILGPNFKEIAEIRLENPETSLKELGEMLSPPVGKSGVNHRLRKISEVADGLRQKKM